MIPVKTNSSEISDPSDIFVALRGHRQDGHDFIPDAVARGARTVIAEHPVPVPDGVRLEIVPDTHIFLRQYLTGHFSRSFSDLKLIGITGTNGKTTTCYLIYQMCLRLSVPCAYIGTIGFYCCGAHRPLSNTTPDILTLYRLLMEAKDAGCRVVVMEVSSHALVQERIAGLSFDIAGFTNLTRDHLDYHHDMSSYLAAKQRILSYLKPNGTMLINQDDPHYRSFLCSHSLRIGRTADGIRLEACSFSSGQTSIRFTWCGHTLRVMTSMTGLFNVYNYLFALGAMLALGYSPEELLPLAGSLQPPPGRLQTLSVHGGLVVVDYAHNPDAVYRVLDFYRKNTAGFLRTVIGCAGDRDRTKRPLMGQIAVSLSDEVFFTNDDPHSETPEQIFGDLTQKLPAAAHYEIIPDRKEAIFRALGRTASGDTTLILGKGHEEVIQFADKTIPHNDVKAVREYLEREGQ